jgi:fatty-acyl-CoA synthase
MKRIRKTIGGLLEDVAQSYADHEALVHTEKEQRYSYGLLTQEIRRVARGFIQTGIRKGDKVALWARNIPEWMISFLGLIRMGACVVPVDPGAGRDDLHYILDQSECRGIVVGTDSDTDSKTESGDEAFVHSALWARDRIPSLEKIFVVSDTSGSDTIPWTELLACGKTVAEKMLSTRSDAIAPEDPVAIMYTSGTTGKPKGVVLDHLGLINKSMFSTQRQGINPKDRLCHFFPLFHMFGNTCISMAGLFRGAAIIMPCRIFEPTRILKAIHDETCTAVYGSPSMLLALLDHPDFRKDAWASVRKGVIGGAPCPMKLMRQLVEDIGVSDITVAYGITEASSWITMTHPKDPIDLRVSTIGTPLESNEIKIVDPATGDRLPAGSQGELCTKGFLMKEYYKMPAATSAAIDRKGWFHTGDLGTMDEKGYVRISGRLKDVIVRDGIEIHPVDVEEILYKNPEVSEAQVFGFPDSEKGQEVAAWIKLKKGTCLSLEELISRVQAQLEPERAPRFYKFVSDFPMTGSGKVQKFKLAQMAQQEYVNQT